MSDNIQFDTAKVLQGHDLFPVGCRCPGAYVGHPDVWMRSKECQKIMQIARNINKLRDSDVRNFTFDKNERRLKTPQLGSNGQ